MGEPAFHDISWLAVPGLVDRALLEALGLTDTREVTWSEGMTAVAGGGLSHVFAFEIEGQAHSSRVPTVRALPHDWSLFVGGWFGDDGVEDRAVEACVAASRLRGSAFAFTMQGRMGWYAWMAAQQGNVSRRLVWEGEPIVDDGAPMPEENWDTDVLEDTIGALASRYAAGADEVIEIEGLRPAGLLAVTRPLAPTA